MLPRVGGELGIAPMAHELLLRREVMTGEIRKLRDEPAESGQASELRILA